MEISYNIVIALIMAVSHTHTHTHTHTHSARIGKLEDDEDIRKEQEELRSHKKQKLNPNRTNNGPKGRSGRKQSKLSFR